MARLCRACQNGTDAEILEVLSNITADPNFRDEEGNSPVYYACRRDMPVIVEALAQRGYKLEQVTNKGKSALHIAAASCSQNVVELLLTAFPALVNCRCAEGLTVIHSAVEGGSRDIFHRFLSANLDPKAICFSKKNVIHIACEKGNNSMFAFLASTYPDLLPVKAVRDWSVVHFAAMGGNVQIMEYLYKDVGFNLLQTTNDNTTPLHFACARGKLEMVKFLLHKMPNQLQIADIQGYQAIHQAACNGNVEIFKILLAAGASVMKRTAEGLTVLHNAAYGSNLDMVEFLVDNFPSLLNVEDSKGRSALFPAAESGSVPVVRLLIERGMDPHALSGTGSTILHMACVKRKTAMAEYLVSEYRDLVTIIDERGCAAIHSAAEGGDVNLFDKMCRAGAPATAEFGDGLTVLHIACGQGRDPDMIRHILDIYPEMMDKCENKLGCCPCHYVAKFHNLETFKMLESKGADMYKATVQGNTILHLACETANMQVVDYILSKYPRLTHQRNKLRMSALDFALASKNAQLVHLIHTKTTQQVKREIFLSNFLVILVILLAFGWTLWNTK